LRGAIDSLKAADDRLESRLSTLEVNVASKYVTRQEVSDANRDMRQDLRQMRDELLGELRWIKTRLGELDAGKVDK